VKGRRVLKKKPSSGDEAQISPEEDMDKVVLWRLRGLQELGFEDTVALRLASDRSVDVYRVAELLKAGCSHKIAADIYS
jgi:hypothetical protein